MSGKKKVYLWGDSVARGVLYDEARRRYVLSPVTAAGIIAEKMNVDIINHARMGITVKECTAIVDRDLSRAEDAEYAILEIGGNDCDFNWSEISENPSESHLPRTPASEYEEKYGALIRKVKDAGLKPFLANLPPIQADRYFDFITRNGLSRENILSWLGDKNHIYRFHEHYSGIVNRLAARYGCKLLDIRSAFLSEWDTADYFCADGIHPTASGQRFIGNAILGAF